MKDEKYTMNMKKQKIYATYFSRFEILDNYMHL